MKNLFLFCFCFLLILTIKSQTNTTIYFDSNRSELKKDALKVLDSLVSVLKNETNYTISIRAHSDNTGTAENNQVLSEQRASAVANHLKKKNIRSSFMDAKGFGEMNPVADNTTETGKAKNRRAEITITVITSVPVAPPPTAITAPVIEEKEAAVDETITMTHLEVGKTLVLENLNFVGGTATLLPEARPTLEKLLKTMRENPTLVIEIGGHVCCYDDMPLSIQRAKAVYHYLVKNGIDKNRMTYKGYSRNRPIVEDDSNEYNARLNRRVEITVLKK